MCKSPINLWLSYFRVKALLSEAQGLKKGSQHPLPWYPPTCITLAIIPEGRKSYDHVTAIKERDKVPSRFPDPTMKHVSTVFVVLDTSSRFMYLYQSIKKHKIGPVDGNFLILSLMIEDRLQVRSFFTYFISACEMNLLKPGGVLF